MRWLRMGVFVVLGMLCGCQSYLYKDYSVKPIYTPPTSVCAADDAICKAAQLQVAISKTKDDDVVAGHIVDKKCFLIPAPADLKIACQQQRNAAIATLFMASEDLCQAHLKSIFGNEATFNIASGSVSLLASGFATVANAVGAKTALAAVATIATGERALVNETVYKSAIVTAVTKKIRDARETTASQMRTTNLQKGIDDYPMVVAMQDVITFHYSCSFMLGLQKALDEGVQGNVDTQIAKLEQTKQNLEQYMIVRTTVLTQQAKDPNASQADQAKAVAAALASDPGLAGAKNRVAAIETQLLALTNSANLTGVSIPSLALTADKSVVSKGATVTLTIVPTDPSIKSLSLTMLDGATVTGGATIQAPFKLPYVGDKKGDHSIALRVVDGALMGLTTNTVKVTVTDP